MMQKVIFSCLLSCLLSVSLLAAGGSIAEQFVNPPPEYKPWVYWFWNNGNITKYGITSDLEAMKRVGIKGVLIMEVGQGAPRGPLNFMKPQWREHFTFMIQEANRLGIEVNMNNDAGWNGSGGWWIKPDEAMQTLVWVEAVSKDIKDGDKIIFERPKCNFDYYEDIALLAFPTPKDLTGKVPTPLNSNRRDTKKNNNAVVAKDKVVDLTDKFDAKTNTLTFSLSTPYAGESYTFLRIGHTAKNINVGPVPLSCVDDGGGRALECDKLSHKGADAAFYGQIGELTKDNKDLTGKTFISTHIDSWENGSQNWTGKMKEEFKTFRNYDITPFLPVFAGYVVDNTDTTDRFLWDFRKVVSELVLNRYARRFSELSHKHGIKLSIEAYGAPTDPMEYGGIADEPMGEFWMNGSAFNTCRGMASAAHIYGKPVVGAEACTSGREERWLHHPGSIKTACDRAFGEGIQRLVFHRYSMQPWADNIVPGGLMMGPWGLHYERSQTWWEKSKVWHDYLTRCQFVLRSGKYVADILYMENEELPQGYTGGFADHPRKGFQWDQCSSPLVKELKVENEQLVAPSGLKYRILALPVQQTMSLELLEKLAEFAESGATIIAQEPQSLPGLSYTKEQQTKFDTLKQKLFHSANKRVVWGKTPEEILQEQNIAPSFVADKAVYSLHRMTENCEIFFIANPQNTSAAVNATFRAKGKLQFWYPETGKITDATAFCSNDKAGTTSVFIPLQATESVFAVFTRESQPGQGITEIKQNGQTLISLKSVENIPAANIKILSAKYGVLSDPSKMLDVKEKLQKAANEGKNDFSVTLMAQPVDPAFKVVKTLEFDYELDGKKRTWQGTDLDNVNFFQSGGGELAVSVSGKGFTATKSGEYETTLSNGKTIKTTVKLPEPKELTGEWNVQFPKKELTFDKLTSWTELTDDYVKYFSGTAVYRKKFDYTRGESSSVLLDLGNVQNIAEVKLNGKDLGTLWTLTKRVDVSDVLKDGENILEVKVTNLWVNRLIGDAKLPDVPERTKDGKLTKFPEWVIKGEAIPNGRSTFCMWNLWSGNENPLPSGLLGPVQLVPVQNVEVVR